MEKAYAKAFGSYEKIEAGLAGDALRDLTGAPCLYLILEDLETHQIWENIVKY
jgi:calpain-15